MNTERPDHDDAEARAAADGTRDTGGASGGDGRTAAGAGRGAGAREPGTAPPDAGAPGAGPGKAAAEGSGKAPADASAEGPADDSAEGPAHASAGTSAEGPAAVSAERPAHASGKGPADVSGQALADTSGKGPAAVSAEGPAHASGKGPADVSGQALADTSGKGPAGVSGKEPADVPGEGPAGVSREAPVDVSREGPADVSRAGDADGSSAGRRRSPALIASVAAVLLVGGGGAWLAAGASGGAGGGTVPGGNGDATPPPLVLDGFSEDAPNGIAPGEPNPYGTTYRADGTLPDGPGSAPVYRARGQVTEERVAALARALGVEGKPVADGESWRIGGRDGSGPTLRVDRRAPGAWTFSRYTPGTDHCKGATCSARPTGGPLVSEAAARKAAAPVLKAVGQDDAKLDARQVMGASRVVNADPEVGGLPTYGWTTGVVVGAQGEVVGGSGRLAAPVKGDTYPVVSAGKALELMNAAPDAGRRGGVGGCASPVPLEEPGRRDPCGAATTTPGKDSAKDTVTVGKAVFGLAAHAVDGRPALVPSWLFEVRPRGAGDALTVTYPAVDPEYLATGAPSRPSGASSPEPTAPGDEPTSAPSPGTVEVEGYTAEGSELTVSFSGGVCADYEATAGESGDRVTVTVTETPWPDAVCIMIAKQYQQTVRLAEPLGDREVVGADGEPVPLRKDGARLPAPPSGNR